MTIRILFFLIVSCLASVTGYYLFHHQEPVCSVCKRVMHKVTTYRISLGRGEVIEVCCPRCGLYLQQVQDDIVKKEVADFSSGALLDAEKAYYVEGSSVHLCCSDEAVQKDRSGMRYERTWDRCLPSLIAFRTEEDAERFVQQHGGAVKVYSELKVDEAGMK